MSIYKSEQVAYSPLKKKNVPVWKLDTNTMTVTHFNPETLIEENKTYHADYIRYHLHYSASKYSDRLRGLINEGRIIEYLDDMEMKVSKAIESQVEHWKKSDKEYQAAVLCGDTNKAKRLENCLVYMAREVIFECMIYV